MFQNIGFTDWGIILLAVLILFGGKKIPELAASLGKSVFAFKKGVREGKEELKKELKDK